MDARRSTYHMGFPRENNGENKQDGRKTMPTGMEISLNWHLTGAMIEMETTGCNILKPTAVLMSDPVTIGWMKQRLDTTLGTEAAPVQQLWMPPQTLPPALQPVINMSAVRAPVQGKGVLPEMGMAALSGWCNLIQRVG